MSEYEPNLISEEGLRDLSTDDVAAEFRRALSLFHLPHPPAGEEAGAFEIGSTRYWMSPWAAPVVLRWTAARRGQIGDEALSLIAESIEALGQGERNPAVDDRFRGEAAAYSGDVEAAAVRAAAHQQQFRHVLTGLLHGVSVAGQLTGLTAEEIKNLGIEKFGSIQKSLQACLHAYHQAWNRELYSRSVPVEVNHTVAGAEDDRATVVLGRFADSLGDAKSPAKWTRANWLLVRRLLSYLLGDNDVAINREPGRNEQNESRTLLVSGNDAAGYRGLTAPLRTSRHLEGFASAYLDPIALGVGVLDADMLHSLQIAARLCRAELSRNEASASNGNRVSVVDRQALRIAVTPRTAEAWVLGGGSAGGLAVLSAWATAQGRPLNRGYSASFTVRVRGYGIGEELGSTIDHGDLEFGAVDERSVWWKVQPSVLRPADVAWEPISRVLVHGAQRANTSDDVLDFKAFARAAAGKGTTLVPVRSKTTDEQINPAHSADTLASLVEQMTSDESLEKVLRDYAQSAVKQWNDMLEGNREGDDDHHLDTYVEPRLNVRLRGDEIGTYLDSLNEDERESARGPHSDGVFKPLDGGVQSLVDDYIDCESRDWLLITDRAGGGKTVLSWALRAAVSERDSHTPYIAVRFEDTGNWPFDKEGKQRLREKLKDELDDVLVKHPSVSSDEVIEYAIQQRRVVVILDALDQVDLKQAGQLRSLDGPASDFRSDRVRVVVTSRPHRPDQLPSEVFGSARWRRFELQPFNDRQIRIFIGKHIRAGWRGKTCNKKVLAGWRQAVSRADLQGRPANDRVWDLLTRKSGRRRSPINDRVWDLLTLPVNLKHIRTLIDNAFENRKEMRTFRVAGDLWFEVGWMACERNPYRGKNANIDQQTEKKFNPTDLMRGAACLAFEVFLETGTYYIDDTEVADVLRGKAEKYFGETSPSKSWEQCLNVLHRDVLSSGSVFSEVRYGIRFPNQKTLEFYVGFFLARYADDESINRLRHQIGNMNWFEAWQFAIEMPQTTCRQQKPQHRDAAYERSMRLLYERPAKYERPTKLMYRAWLVHSERRERDGTGFSWWEAMLTDYRQDFVDVMNTAPIEQAMLAADLLHGDDLRALCERDGFERTYEELRPAAFRQLCAEECVLAVDENGEPLRDAVGNVIVERPKGGADVSYARISDATHQWSEAEIEEGDERHRRHEFYFGASRRDTTAYGDERSGDEASWIASRVDVFDLSRCCVTRGQYELFDAAAVEARLFKQDEQGNRVLSGTGKVVPDPDSPMVEVDWYDSWSFCLWLGEGYRLPSELEWEAAAWGGLDRQGFEDAPSNANHEPAVIGVRPYTKQFTNAEVNHDGTKPMSGAEKSGVLRRTLAVRWSGSRSAEPSASGEALVGSYETNGFGVWQMSGNVLEWCASQFREALADAAHSGEETNIDVASDCSLRGGSFFYDARICRCSLRFRFDPDIRGNGIGFRVARTGYES